jgi:acyl-CoA thioester hydrolase
MTEGIIRFKVRYAETDQMGFVHHPHYLIWFEIGRTELMRQLGYAYADIEREGTLLAVAEVSLRYARAARYDDDILLVTRVAAVQSRTITFSYRVLREHDADLELLATGVTRLIAIDRAGAPKRLPAELLQRFRETTASSA